MTKTTAYLIIALVLVSASAFGQVSVYTEPDSDAIIFEDYRDTTHIVIPQYSGSTVTIDGGIAGDSTYIVSPGGYYTQTYEVENDE